MKKILMIMILVLGFTGCTITKNTDEEKKPTNNEINTKSGDEKGIKANEEKNTKSIDINYDEFSVKVKNKETFALLMWQTGCTHCETFEPKLNKVIKKYNIKMYSMDLSKLDEIEYAKMKNKTFINGTPTMVFLKDGITQSTKLVGNKSEEDIIEFFKEYEVIR